MENIPGPEIKHGSPRQTKEEIACQWVTDFFKKNFVKKEQMLEKNPVFEAKGRTYEIKNETDKTIAVVQLEALAAEEILRAAELNSDYYGAKIAAKLLDFKQTQARLLSLRAEAKDLYPELAELYGND